MLSWESRSPHQRSPFTHVHPLLPQEDEGAGFVADDHVWFAVAVDVAGHHLGADAAIVVDEVRGPGGLAAFALELEPPEDVRRVRLGVAMRAVRPVAFAGDDILEAVAIHID